MSVSVELKHLLLQVLPSPAMMAQGSLLCIQNHLAMVCDSLWAINSMIIIPEMGMLHNKFFEQYDSVFNLVHLDVPAEFADWKTDVAVAVIDVGELLSRIMDWEASLHRSIVGNCTQQVQYYYFRHVILVELKEMLCNLNSLVLRGSAMGLRRDPMSSMNPLREDYSIVLKNEVVGREKDVEKLIAIFQQQQLVSFNNNDDHDDSNPFVIVIVGKQGIGKTTLAHMIYHHTWVRQQFHHRIWVNLPYVLTFKMINIIGNEFVRSINKEEEYCDQKLQLDLPLPAMWEYINEQLCGSRYLLVLHCENLVSLMQSVPDQWNEVKNILLRVGGPGSGVLITYKSSTLQYPVSYDDMGFLNGMKDITTYSLNPLSEDAWVEVFKRHAATTILPSSNKMQLDKSEKDEYRLIPLAKKHFPILIGQPFVAKVIGRYYFQKTFKYYRYLQHLVTEQNYMVANFPLVIVRLLRYHHLLLDHADAVNYFNNDYDVISHMLTAEYLIPTEGLGLDWIQYYQGFFRLVENPNVLQFLFPSMVYLHMKLVPAASTTTIPRCCRYLCLKINPIAKAFRRPTMPVEVSKKLIALILREDDDEEEEEITLQVYKKRRTKTATAISKFLDKIMSVRFVHLRILVVETGMIQSLPSEVGKLVNLRCLRLSKLKMELLPKSLFNLTNLLILSLLRCEKLQNIPERIHKLKKLQILKLAYCIKLQRLPNSITRLKNLQVLDVEGCCFLSNLPEDLVSFESLRVLNVAGCATLSQIPHGIEQSIDLRKLSGIFVGVDGGFVLTQLQALTNLQEIRLRNLERAEETRTEMLMGQESLRDLSLHWGGEEGNESSESAATPLQVLEALRPNVHLKRLEIISYKGVEFPTWMSKQQLARFDSLVEIKLINLRRCATLPSLGQLFHLEKLEISGMDLITHIDNTFYGDGDTFRMLTELTFSEMLALEKWSAPKRKNAYICRKLRQLTLIQCPKLKGIHLHTLPRNGYDVTMRVWLNNETIWSAEFCSWYNLRNIKRIEIVGCQELRCLPQGMRSLILLDKMTINNCNNLATLVALDSLEVLHIYACPVLAFNLEAFTGLSDLKIKGCPKMQM